MEYIFIINLIILGILLGIFAFKLKECKEHIESVEESTKKMEYFLTKKFKTFKDSE